jgi:hypothetical protein
VNDLVEGRLLKFGNNKRMKQRTGNWLSYPFSFTNLRSKTDSDCSSRHSATFPETIGESLQGRRQGGGGVGMKMWRWGTTNWGNISTFSLRIKPRMENKSHQVRNSTAIVFWGCKPSPLPAITCENPAES